MDAQARDYAARIQNGLEPIDDEFSARAVAEFIKQLCKSLVQVTITPSEVEHILNRPMTPGDAISAFERFIIGKTHGQNQNDVRIVFKSEITND